MSALWASACMAALQLWNVVSTLGPLFIAFKEGDANAVARIQAQHTAKSLDLLQKTVARNQHIFTATPADVASMWAANDQRARDRNP